MTNLLKWTCGVLLCGALAYLARERSMEGWINGVDPRHRTLLVTAEDGSRHTFEVSDGAVVRDAGGLPPARPETLYQLRPGMDVEVYFRPLGRAATADEVDTLCDAPGQSGPGCSAPAPR